MYLSSISVSLFICIFCLPHDLGSILLHGLVRDNAPPYHSSTRVTHVYLNFALIIICCAHLVIQSGYEPSPKICRFITNSLNQNPKIWENIRAHFKRRVPNTGKDQDSSIPHDNFRVADKGKGRAENTESESRLVVIFELAGRCYVAEPMAYEKAGSFYCNPDLNRISEGVNTSPRIWLWLSFCLHGFWWQLMPRWQARIW